MRALGVVEWSDGGHVIKLGPAPAPKPQPRNETPEQEAARVKREVEDLQAAEDAVLFAASEGFPSIGVAG
jgi:hypothetical protein